MVVAVSMRPVVAGSRRTLVWERECSRGLVLEVESWLGGFMCQVEECPNPGGPIK